MKFGEKYRMLMAPEWEEFYVPYNSLKIRFNELLVNGYHSGTKARLAGLYADIEHWNQVYTGFSDKMRVFLKRQFMAGAFYSVSENVHFIRASVEVRDEYEKLLLFDLMNEKALSKLSKKLERCNHFADADQHTPIQVPKNHLKTTDVIMHISSYVDKILGSILRGQPDTKYLNIITANFPRRFARAICRAAEADDVALLNHVLHWKDAQESDDARYINLLSTVLVLSVAWHARGSTEYIVRQLLDFPDIEFGRLLCQIVTITGRMDLEIHAALDRGDPARIQESTGVGFFASVLSQLGRSKKESSLMQTDLTGRIPLHYAAMYGLTEICQSIMETCYQLAPRYCAACLEITDDTGYTPMYYAVASNRPEIVKMFIKILGNNYDKHDAARFQNLENTVEKLLCMAMRDGYDAVVQILAESGIGAKAFPDNRTTGLHVAAEVGRADYIKLLIANGRASEVFFQEPLRGWTPLITACAGGHLAAVNALLEMASWPDPHDSLGWTAKEHAVSRGHLAVAELIPDCSCDRLTGGPAAGLTKPPIRPNFRRALDSSLIHLVLHPGNVQGGDESCFGVANENDPRGTWVVELSASDVGEPINSGSQQSHRIDVPSLDDHTFSPVVFSGFSQTKICLRCRVLELDVNGMATTVVGNGVAMLGNASTRLAEGCEGISRTITVPIFGLDLSSVIAKVTFSYVMSKPFVLSDLPLGKRADGAERAAIVGHRGLGRRDLGPGNYHFGQSTIESFLGAADLGASLVEMDVQLTKDRIPIAYHNFLFEELGMGARIHELTLKQFMYINEYLSPEAISIRRVQIDQTDGPRYASYTQYGDEGNEVSDLIKYSREIMDKGFRKNVSEYLLGTYGTLEELFFCVPGNVGFNIVIKYPIPGDVEAGHEISSTIEINTFVDTILDMVVKHVGSRPIILSSFSPEVCILLSLKQQVYPVMFMTHAIEVPEEPQDLRTTSLRNGVAFAKVWDLSGIFVPADHFVFCPRLIQYVKRQGLICGSFGPLNNSMKNVNTQAECSIDMIVTDRVAHTVMNLEPRSSRERRRRMASWI